MKHVTPIKSVDKKSLLEQQAGKNSQEDSGRTHQIIQLQAEHKLSVKDAFKHTKGTSLRIHRIHVEVGWKLKPQAWGQYKPSHEPQPCSGSKRATALGLKSARHCCGFSHY